MANEALMRLEGERPTALTPIQELQMQIIREGDLEKLKELRAMEKEWRADQAKQAFNIAFAEFKAEAVTLLRTKQIADGPLAGKKHVVLGEVVRVATPALSKHGLSISWKLSRDDKDWMEVTCTLRHIEGHSETVSMGGAPDTGPGRNAIQARGSAKTYLERYTATAILGLAPEEDDDGRGAASAMDENVMLDWLNAIADSGSAEELKKNYMSAMEAARKADDKAAIAAFNKAKRDCWAKNGGFQ